MYQKRGYHTPEVEAARKKTNEARRQKADEKYRRLFYERGLDAHFDYIRFEGKNQILVRCNRCGTETIKTHDAFIGRQTRLFCKECGNGTLTFSDEVNDILAYYAEGHSIAETCEKYNIDAIRLNGWVKRRGVTNGRTVSEINTEKARKAAEKTLAEREKKAIEIVNGLGFEYLGGYQKSDGFITVKCKTCGEETSRNFTAFRDGTATCKTCRHNEARAKQEQEKKKRELEQAQKKALKKLLNPLGLSYYQLAREKKLDEAGVCIVCGREYKVRDYVRSTGAKTYTNPGYCSIECKNKNKNKREHERRKELGITHYARARKLGLPREKGITLPKVFERDGGICQLCFMPCLYYGDYLADLYPSIDHIIPLGNDPEKKGGHTWKNVQLAHRICNSNKRDYYGKEWNNAD